MEEQQIKDIFHFVDSVLQHKSDAEHRSIQSTLDLAEGVAKVIEENKHLVPYHLNLIDELHINENGHSRILCKLLEYCNPEGRYIFLESLLRYIAKDCEEFGKICVIEPEITQELRRIDLWVQDKAGGYAIIFENKVYNACDQEAQLSRYIKCTKANRFTDGQIFVVYLPQSDDKDPSEDSWGEYKEVFVTRYAKFSFCNGVLPWLKSDELPLIPDKDNLLKSAIEQYVDYLEGLFKQRESDKQLYIMVENYIKKELELNDNPFENKKKLDRKIEELDEVRKYLDNMVDDYKKQMFEQWSYRINEEFTYEKTYTTSDKEIKLFVKIPICGKSVYAGLYKEKNGRIYYGLSTLCEEDPKDVGISEVVNPILGNLGIDIDEKNKVWYGWKYIELDNQAYYKLVGLIKEIEKVK